MTMADLDAQIKDLANALAGQCEAIANGEVIGPVRSAVARIRANAETLLAWSVKAEEWEA